MCEKDCSLLRPFDKDVVKAGDLLIHISTSLHRTFVCGPDTDCDIVTSDPQGLFFLGHQRNWKIAPLCWVEGKPVYPDSVLYDSWSGTKCLGENVVNGPEYTWEKPKQKKTGWVNIYPTRVKDWEAATSHAFTSKEEADKQAILNRVACVQIEWEE